MKVRSLQLKYIGVFEDETISFPEKKDKDLAEIHILTGENGTGKTTILQTIAFYLFQQLPFKDFRFLPFSKKSSDNLNKRLIHEKCNGNHGRIKFDNDSENPFPTIGSLSIYQVHDDKIIQNILNVEQKEQQEKINEDKKDKYLFQFCAFAYSSYRRTQHEENINISQNILYPPIADALEFDKENDSNSFNKWIALNSSKRALAREKGDLDQVERFDRNIRLIEEIIKEIIEKNTKLEIVYDTGIKIVVNLEGQKLDFDLLPDGLRSLMSWIGDLLMRMDLLKWKDDLPISEREFILLLDEIEVHLHPAWQRKILPVIQKTFKNSQIFITTHSPFIINSVDGAFIHKLKLINNNVKVLPYIISENGDSIGTVLKDIFGINEEFGSDVQEDLEKFQVLRDEILGGRNEKKEDFLRLGRKLSSESLELNTIVQFELRQLNRILKQNWDYAEV